MRLATTAALIAAATLAVGAAVPAQAAAPPRVDLRGAGVGSYVVDDTGSALITGDVTGKPFDGAYDAVLTAADGTLPEPGVCEPAAAAVDITGSRDRFLQLGAAGEVCGEWTGPNSVVTHRFVGRYDVTGSSVRNVRATDGWISLILATEGRANIEVFDS